MTLSRRKLEYIPISEVTPDPKNPRRHSREQIKAIARSMEEFGCNVPIVLDRHKRILAGHGRHQASVLLGYTEVPVICADDLSPEKAKAFMLADNKLNERSSWDEKALAIHLKELSELSIDFEIEVTGFETPEIDLLIQSLDDESKVDADDQFEGAKGPSVSRPGDLWHMEGHRLYCGSALEPNSFQILLGEQQASAVFTDAPYNVKIRNVGGRGKNKHREFLQASGEQTEEEFTAFLSTAFGCVQKHLDPGALFYACMDWRHMREMLAAARTCKLSEINVCVWAKTNGGMGSL